MGIVLGIHVLCENVIEETITLKIYEGINHIRTVSEIPSDEIINDTMAKLYPGRPFDYIDGKTCTFPIGGGYGFIDPTKPWNYNDQLQNEFEVRF